MDDDAVRKDLLIGFEYSHLHDSWVNPLADALDGVTAEQAIWRPGPDMKGIWDIVLHMAAWNENIIERIGSGEIAYPPGRVAWPPPPSAPSDEQWLSAKTRLWDSLAALREMIETIPIIKIQESPYGIGDLLCRFIHNAYHIGQITKLRECQGS